MHRSNGRFCSHRVSGRSRRDGWARFRSGRGWRSGRRPGNYRPSWRFGRDGRGCCRRRGRCGYDGRRRARLRNDFAWGRFCRSRWRRCRSGLCDRLGSRRSGLCGLGRWWRGALGRGGRFLFFFLQDSLEHVAGFGDVRKVYFGLGRSIGPRGGCAGFAALKVGAHTLSLIFFQRTGVGLLLSNTYSFENIKNGSALDFQFTC